MRLPNAERAGPPAARRPAQRPITAAALALLIAALAGCATPGTPRQGTLTPELQQALQQPSAPPPIPAPPAELAQALLPPPDLSLAALAAQPEPRFDLNVSALPAAQVFAALARDTRYSMLVDPELTAPVTVTLKDVTLVEALDTLRDMYGFEYRIEGTRIFVQKAALATRVFQVNYLAANRSGRSEVRMTSGSIVNAAPEGQFAPTAPTAAGVPVVSAQESGRVTTQTANNLWAELEASLKLLIGDKDGRQLILSPQSGVIVVRAMPKELRAVEQYLRAARLNVERQVMLEAKIIDVRLRDGTQTGINWAAFRTGANHRGAGGLINPDTTLATTGELSSGPLSALPGSALSLAGTAASGLFGLAFQSSNFAALIAFLETQGDVQVLSSPRIATLNNQKAVLKVGTDDFFVTGITTSTTTSSAGGNVTSPTISVQPFFSGIALDVTPQIDEDANITLHVHPSVSNVSERTKVLNLGQLGGIIALPLASSTVAESDTIVRVRDGAIVAIGGLMKSSRTYDRNQVPVLGNLPVAGHLLGSSKRETDKHELVILLKPTVIHSDAQTDALRDEVLQRVQSMARGGRL
jgi:MSHA biogenesis protein MshL